MQLALLYGNPGLDTGAQPTVTPPGMDLASYEARTLIRSSVGALAPPSTMPTRTRYFILILLQAIFSSKKKAGIFQFRRLQYGAWQHH